MVRGLRLAFVLALGLGVAVWAAPSPASRIGYGIDARGIAELSQKCELARRLPKAAADSAWLDIARFALMRATSRSTPGAQDDPNVSKALRAACSHLGAADLAAAAAFMRHPMVSEAFLAALVREQPGGYVPWSCDAASEARDAFDFHGPSRGKVFLEALRKYGTPAFGAGGAEQSVFAVDVFDPHIRDSSSVGFAVRAGLVQGIRDAGGRAAERILVSGSPSFDDNDIQTSFRVHTSMHDGAGVMIVAGGSSAWAQAAASARERGMIAVDARPRSRIDPHTGNEWPPHDDLADGTPPPFFQLGWSLSYKADPPGSRRWVSDRLPVDATNRPVKPFLLRPPDFERARCLVDVIRSRPAIRKVAIAVSESGAGYGLAACLAKACQDYGIAIERLDYAAGRRDYAPEVARFATSSADALVLAGPGEESAEWLVALGRRKLHPLVLGDRELDPAGFHPAAQAALDGAVLVDDEWIDDAGSDRATQRAAADSLGFEGSADFARGYAFGRLLALELMHGAYTPSRLLVELDSASLPDMYGASDWHYLGARWAVPGGAVIQRHIPLLTVRKGALEALDLR